MPIGKSFILGLIGSILGLLMVSVAFMVGAVDPPAYAVPLLTLGLAVLAGSIIAFWLLIPGVIIGRKIWRRGSYGRRFLLIVGVSSVIFASLFGIGSLAMVSLDAYPVVPAEGFSLERKASEVLGWFLSGLVIGLILGLPTFAASLLIRPVKRQG